MSETATTEAEYVVEHVDGPLAGTIDRRVLVHGEIEERIASVAAVRGLESVFWYVAGDKRELDGETYVKYYFDRVDSDPVKSVRDTESD